MKKMFLIIVSVALSLSCLVLFCSCKSEAERGLEKFSGTYTFTEGTVDGYVFKNNIDRSISAIWSKYDCIIIDYSNNSIDFKNLNDENNSTTIEITKSSYDTDADRYFYYFQEEFHLKIDTATKVISLEKTIDLSKFFN